jgi:membrane associated rhomboid family serine protease
VSRRSGAKYLAIALAGATVGLSLVGRSRGWLHTAGRWHDGYHVGLFAVLGVLCMFTSRGAAKRADWLVWMVVLGFGIESLQAILNHTTMEWADVWSDVGGLVLGGVVGWVLSLREASGRRGRRSRRRRDS